MTGKSNYTKGFLYTLFILVIWLPASGAYAKYGGGTGEPNAPYLIYTSEQMNSIGTEPNDWDKYFKLMADIDLADYTETEFNIIGTGGNPFTGIFDGNGHAISNFNYRTSDDEYCFGLFGYIDDPNAIIINLGLIAPDINIGTDKGIVGSLTGRLVRGIISNCYAVDVNVSGKRYVGGLVGSNVGLITDCFATGNVTGDFRVGGLAGDNLHYGHITKSYSSGNVSGNYNVGGLIGTNYYDATVTNCYSNCHIEGNNDIGGLVGENNSHVANCNSYGSLDAKDRVGGLIGWNDGFVTTSCSYASVKGQDAIGGLVGENSFHGQIVDCYANGEVFGQNHVGGLLGKNDLITGHGGDRYFGKIHNCYSIAVVTGDQQTGGFVGSDDGGGVSNDSFWDIQSSGWKTSAGGIGKTTAEMQDPNMFIDAGWDFYGAADGPSDIWAQPNKGGYPVLLWQLSPVPELPTFSRGMGTPENPYLISTADELNSIGHNPRLMTAHFKLINDINMTGIDFFMIANQWYPFSGTFDGNRHFISNINYNSAEATCAGFISYASGAQIKDLGLVDLNIQVDGGDFHGALVGLLESGTITNCYVESGNVSGNDYIGGLVGDNDSESIIMSCYSTGSVRGNDSVGGLVGTNSGTIMNCYSHSSATGSDYIGGLVGSNYGPGEIYNCYATGDAHAKRFVSGLLARNFGGSVIQSFWDKQTSGWPTSAAGGTGLTTTEMQTESTFLNAGWDFVDETVNGTEDIWWILEGQDYPRLWWEQISVILIEPHNGEIFEISSEPPLLLAQVNDPEGTIINVRFDIEIDLASGTGHGHTSAEAQNGPQGWFYQFDWSDRGAGHGSWLIPGEYTITAEAIDDHGTVYVSPEVTITIL